MKFELPKLPYSPDALEPYIDKETVLLHHGKHHQAYVDNFNKALESYPQFFQKSVEEILSDIDSIPQKIRQAVENHGGGHANHKLYWETMISADKSSLADGELKKTLENTFGDFDSFKQNFTDKAMSLFGSGWVFLTVDPNKKLIIKRHSFQNSPLSVGSIPILTLDLWEHAYYLKYRNKKIDYVNAWWNVVNWDYVQDLFTSALRK